MSHNGSKAHISLNEFDTFVLAGSSVDRLTLLKKWQTNGRTLDASLVRGLMAMPLSPQEIIHCFEIASTNQPDKVELWIMNGLLGWDQNIAGAALHSWSKITNRILWHRLLPILAIPALPQRIRYTILDVGICSHGYEITKATVDSIGWEDLSTAFHALLLERALQYDIPSSRLTDLAWKVLHQNANIAHPEDKSLIPAVGWLCRHSESDLIKWSQNTALSMWTGLVKTALESNSKRRDISTKLKKSVLKVGSLSNKIAQTLPLWSRDVITNDVVTSIVQSPKGDNESLEGFPLSILTTVTENIHSSWVDEFLSHIPFSDCHRFAIIRDTPFSKSYNREGFAKLHATRIDSVNGKAGIATDCIQTPEDFSDVVAEKSNSLHPIEKFFNSLDGDHPLSYENENENAWQLLASAWRNPSNVDLNKISISIRKNKGLVVLAHIMVLSKMVGRDDAVLKLLDYIRSSEELELRALVRAFGKINTSRSLLELIAMLTRPNATITVQQDIVAVLQGKDLKGLQKELRSAVDDLRLPPNSDHPIYQIKDELSSLLVSASEGVPSDRSKPPTIQSSGSKNSNLDGELSGMIPHYNELSSEVKRALRTALFFNKTVVDSQHANSIDLSPLIDMQYKAMELLFREFFEDAVSQSLQRGTIQRKLDVIGYARPIIKNMDEFESFIAGLPIVKDIPFFSKFKLRKMLRAICQFEPGKRFTLDGLKAFGLYFLVFGRQSCKHGLAGMFQVGARDDRELAEFCKELHIFQDFRNRAAHEGFHPDASNDIMGIWRTTASVVQWAFRIKHAQKTVSLSLEKSAS